MDTSKLPEQILIKGTYADRCVTINGKRLTIDKAKNAFLRLFNKVNRFSWGEQTVETRLLSLAILMNFLPESEAIRLYQVFCYNVASQWPKADFEHNFNLRHCVEIEFSAEANGEEPIQGLA